MSLKTAATAVAAETTGHFLMPIMGDICCGRGGWTKGFQLYGWDCWGIDNQAQPLYPGRFILADITWLTELPFADFYCCSTPCPEFSVHCMRHFHKNPKWPLTGIALFEHARELIIATKKLYIMENVRCAERFVGRAANRAGAFYLWGSGVPAILPQNITKGYLLTQECNNKRNPTFKRKMAAIEIPIELSSAIASLYSPVIQK